MPKQKVYISNHSGRVVEVMQEGHFNILVFDKLTQQACEVNKKWFLNNYTEINNAIGKS